MKKVSLLLVLVFAAITMSAQESGFSTKAGRNATFARNGFWDNWFIGVGAGANFVVGDYNSDADFTNRLTLVPSVQVGKWYNPYIGGRAKLQGGSLHNFVNDAKTMYHSKYLAAEVDVMFNFTNYILNYNENRLYNFIPYAGIGYAQGGHYFVHGKRFSGKERNFTINGGIINKFRLSNRVALDIDLSAMLLKENFNKSGSNTYDGLAAATASLVVKVGKKTDFSEALLMDQSLLDNLNGQINKLRQENDKLKNQPAKEVIKEVVKDCPKCPDAKGSFVSNVVFFRIGSANIDRNQEVGIFNTAKFLQDNPNAKVKIIGYADRQTGNPSINLKLSEKRAKNVANALINKYNISSSRVTVEWKGDTVQPYAENAWNRVAIFYTE